MNTAAAAIMAAANGEPEQKALPAPAVTDGKAPARESKHVKSKATPAR